MNINKLFLIIYLSNFFVDGNKIYPTKRWVKICNSSNITSWYKNNVFKLKNYLVENKDALYL